MKRPKPPYLISRQGRGKTYWYYWKRPNPQIRIKGEYGTREFWENYERAASGLIGPRPSDQKEKLPSESLAWLIARYRETSVWQDYAAPTRRQRENIFRRITTANPHLSYGDIDRALIIQTRDAKKDTPSEANNFLDAFRGLFKWAVDAGLVEADPSAGIKNLKRPKSGGFPMWEEEEIVVFQNRWPVGSRERLAFEIFLNTGLRRGDVARLGKQHIRNGRLRIVTEKRKTEVDIPVPSVLLEIIKKSPTGNLAFIGNIKTGNPIRKEALGNWFKRATKLAGIEEKNGHGLRKASAKRLAEAGATIPELNAVFGWVGTSMASLYTEKASRKILADNAAKKLSRTRK